MLYWHLKKTAVTEAARRDTQTQPSVGASASDLIPLGIVPGVSETNFKQKMVKNVSNQPRLPDQDKLCIGVCNELHAASFSSTKLDKNSVLRIGES